MRLRRLPFESAGPIVAFAGIRLALTGAAMVAVAILGLPYGGRLFAVLCVVALPWALVLVVVAPRAPRLALHPLVAVADFALLAGAELVVPETYAAVRFVAIFLVAAHSHFQGEQVGLAVSAGGTALLLAAGALTHGPVGGELLLFYEVLFAVSVLATSAVVGRLRTSESLARLRARGLTRRAVGAEDEIRRRLAGVIHDGPVQELASLELILHAASEASRQGDEERLRELLAEAQDLARRNVRTLRDEIVSLGPQAYDEVSFGAAVERLIPVWQRRYGIAVRADCEEVELPSEVEGDLYRIAQEAVANAGRHAEASSVVVELRARDGTVELRVADDGKGFRRPVLAPAEDAGHLGLASMRERAEALGGELRIETGEAGTEVHVVVPLAGGAATGSGR
jgi:signal transduction histidine kinase